MSGETKIKSRGAIPHTGGVGFRVWAPNAQRVSVIGSFNRWAGGEPPMRAEEDGYLPGKFASVSARLGHLKKLGVNAIQIMSTACASTASPTFIPLPVQAARNCPKAGT